MFFSRKNVRVSVRNKNIVIETKSGVNLYRFLVQEGVILPTLCDGAGQCGKCKIRFLSINPPKPKYKESLILAKINIDAGYRLACQQTVKEDIEIDTSEVSSSVKFLDETSRPLRDEINNLASEHEHEERINFSNVKDVLGGKGNETGNEYEDSDVKSEDNEDTNLLEKDFELEAAAEGKAQEPKEDDSISLSDFRNGSSSFISNPQHGIDGPSDGIFLIQQRNGVRYFCYSAALDNIVSEGVTVTSESLRDVIDNNLISDFIHNVLKIRDIDRVLILLENNESYITVNILDMVNYFRFELGTLLCEVIMPFEKKYDIIRFFRLLNVNKDRRLIFSLDMLDKIHYVTEKMVTEMRYIGLSQKNLTVIKDRGTNPIIDFNEDLTVKAVERKGEEPNGITLSALLQFVTMLLKKGVIDSGFNIRSRKELLKQNVSLSLTVKVLGNEEPTGFFIYRDRFSELILTQTELHMLRQIKSFILSAIRFTEDRLGKPHGLVFYTTTTHDNLINYMFNLGFIPKEFADKISYNPGEATVQAVKLFKEKDIPSFIDANFSNNQKIDLVDEDDFIRAAQSTGLL